MKQRKYSIGEIDQMRACLQHICRDNNAIAEDQLRTYMLNGTDPVEIAFACFEEIQQRMEKARANMRKLRAVTNNDPRWVA